MSHNFGEEDLTRDEIEQRLTRIRLSLKAEEFAADARAKMSLFSDPENTTDEFLHAGEGDDLCYKYEYCMVFKMVGPEGQALKVRSIKANTCRSSVQLYAFASMIYTHTSIDAFIHLSFRKCADY